MNAKFSLAAGLAAAFLVGCADAGPLAPEPAGSAVLNNSGGVWVPPPSPPEMPLPPSDSDTPPILPHPPAEDR